MSNNNTKKQNKAIFNPCAKNPHNISSANLPMEGAWATLVQWRDHGFAVKKGEHPQRVDWEFNGNPRYYNVYHATQCEALNNAQTAETRRKIVELTLEAKAVAEKPAKRAKKAVAENAKRAKAVTAKAVKPAKKAEKPAAKKSAEKPNTQDALKAYADMMREVAKRAQEIAPPKPEGFDAENAKLTKGGYYTLHIVKGCPLTKWNEGYTFEHRGYTFGVSKTQGGTWRVSELGTGMGVNMGNTRKDALQKFAKLANKTIAKLGDDLAFEDARVTIAQAYADAAATDAAMGGC